MKKIHPKNNKPSKTRIQLKIQSKNVTNNFILTPRTTSALDQKEQVHKQQRFTEQLKSDRAKHDQKVVRKQFQSDKKQEHRILTDDHQRIFIKKKIQEDQTGIHTPQIKRISLPTQTKYKRKSLNSLTVSDRGQAKNKKKLGPPKLSKSDSGELNKATLQRVIAVVVKDFKEGKIRQKELEQILIQIYDRREKTKTSSNKKTNRKDLQYQTFSNEFLRSTQQTRRVNKSQALLRKKKKGDEEQLYEGVLQRKGFVNKIIIKGITTSLFLKEDVDLVNVKESEAKVKNKQSFNQICTSNSVKEINQDMRKIEELYHTQIMCRRWTQEDLMAIRIQRAWRRYRTRTLLKKISDPELILVDLEEFTDDQNDREEVKPKLNIFQKHLSQAEEKQYIELVKLVSDSMHQKQISKEECLRSILSFLKGHQQLGKVQEKEEEEQERPQESSNHLELSRKQSSESAESQNVIKISRIKMLDKSHQEEDQRQSSKIDQTPSNELQLNSFTNKYSSKDANDKNQFYAQPMHQSEDFDNSLIFAPSQTSLHETFKMINIHNIEEGLSGREEGLLAKKEKEIQALTDKLFGNSITREKYLAQKIIIQKWYKKQLKELQTIKNALLKTCVQAKKLLQLQPAIPATTQKSKKMFKCLSDKYIKKENWSIYSSNQQNQKPVFQKKVHCEQRQQLPEILSSKKQVQQTNNFTLSKDESLQVQWNHNETQVSPRMQRHKESNQQRNTYKYDQIDKTIQEEEELEHETVGNNLEGQSKFQNEQFTKSIEPYGSEDLEQHEIQLINNMINKQNKKYKYLCNEDKEDIFQFLFLDLVLEMFTETYVGNQRVQKAAQSYIFKAKRLKKIPKGIKTNLASCKQYMNLLSDYLVQQQNSLKNMSSPMGPSATQMLRYMRDEIVETEDEDNIGSTLVLPIQIFQKIGRSKQLQLTLQRYYEDEEREQNRLAFLKTALHINNKALYDSLNEMLDHERPYGVWGKPFPWKKTLSLDRKWTKQQQQKKLKKGIDKTIESCSYLCGIMSDKQDSLFGNHRVTEQYLMQIRQDRLSKMLANELFESEERWIFYDDEETEIQMQVSSFITRKIIKELVLELVSIRIQK